MLEVRGICNKKIHFAVESCCGAGVFLTDCCIQRDPVLLEEVAQVLIPTDLHRFDFVLRPRVHLDRANKAQVHLRVKIFKSSNSESSVFSGAL